MNKSVSFNFGSLAMLLLLFSIVLGRNYILIWLGYLDSCRVALRPTPPRLIWIYCGSPHSQARFSDPSVQISSSWWTFIAFMCCTPTTHLTTSLFALFFVLIRQHSFLRLFFATCYQLSQFYCHILIYWFVFLFF